MNGYIEISVQFITDSWEIKAVVSDSSDADFPRDIFLWDLASDGKLGEFHSIGDMEAIGRYQPYDPARTDNFGIRLVKHTESRALAYTEEEKDKAVFVLQRAFDRLLGTIVEEAERTVEIYPPLPEV